MVPRTPGSTSHSVDWMGMEAPVAGMPFWHACETLPVIGLTGQRARARIWSASATLGSAGTAGTEYQLPVEPPATGIPRLSSKNIVGRITVAETSGGMPLLVPVVVIHGMNAPGSPGSDPQTFKFSE